MRNPYLLLTLLSGISIFMQAQSVLEGLVLNPQKEPLAFVNILLNGDPYHGVASDIDGHFRLEEVRVGDSLCLSYLGYENLTWKLRAKDFSPDFSITLRPQAYELIEAEVIAGDNPAHRVIHQAVRQREQHDPERLKAYRCQTYNKLVFDWLPNPEGITILENTEGKGQKIRDLRINRIQQLHQLHEQQHAMLMESLTQREYIKPQHLKETVLHNRVSGFRHPSFVALANSVQPFSCYQNHLSLLGKDFLNPISKGSTQYYYFQLEDTLYQAPDTIFVISFHPREGSTFEGLKGVLYIHTRGYAIQSIIAEPAIPGKMKMKIEQRYRLVEEEQWFPDQLNFELKVEHYPDKYFGVKINGRSYVREVELRPDLKLRHLGMEGITTAPDAAIRNDSLWETIRLEALNSRERRTYAFMDSLGGIKKFDAILGLTEALVSGGIPVGPVDLKLRHLLSFNDFEETRLGLGLDSNKKLSTHFTLGAYTAYGFADRQWKYGGFAQIHLFPEKEISFGLDFRHDIDEPGTRDYAMPMGLFQSQSFFLRMDNVEALTFNLQGWFLPYTFFDGSLSKAAWTPNYEYTFSEASGDQNTAFDFTELSLRLRFAYGEQFTRLLGSRIRESGKFPVLQLSYAKGLKNFWQGAYDYQKVLLSVEYDFQYRTLGRTSFLLESGWASTHTPYQKLFGTNGQGREFRFLFDEHEFHTMEPYEFLSDRFVEFFFRHNFKTIFGHWKFIRPELHLVHNLSFGTLAAPEAHRDIAFKTLEKGYYETGIILQNLIGINYFNVGTIGLGIGGFYRYGPYSRPLFKDNFGLQATISFGVL